MKLLFDENLSHELVGILAHEFPGSSHVRDIGLRAAEDGQIWDHARTLRREHGRIDRFEKQEETSLLILSIGPTAI